MHKIRRLFQNPLFLFLMAAFQGSVFYINVNLSGISIFDGERSVRCNWSLSDPGGCWLFDACLIVQTLGHFDEVPLLAFDSRTHSNVEVHFLQIVRCVYWLLRGSQILMRKFCWKLHYSMWHWQILYRLASILYIYIYVCVCVCVCVVIDFAEGKGHDNASSNSGRGSLYFACR